VPQYLKGQSEENLVLFLREVAWRVGPISKERGQAKMKQKAKKMPHLGRTVGSLSHDRACRVKAKVISQLCREIRRIQEDMVKLDNLLEKASYNVVKCSGRTSRQGAMVGSLSLLAIICGGYPHLFMLPA